jgi:type III pantothenate kinase
MSLLLVDAGNARVKWAISEADELGSVGHADFSGNPQLAISGICAAADETVDQIVVGNVAGREFGDRLQRELQRCSSADVWFARSAPQTAGVRCGYPQAEMLGVDRWAAIVAAAKRARKKASGRAFCIVDAGTALTIDAVDHESMHLGGLILPGVHLQRQALLDAAADIAVTQDEIERASFGPGLFATSTAQALAVSGPLACAAAIDRCVAELSAVSPMPWLVMTGGDASQIVQWLATPVDICPNLVFEGLAIMFEQRSVD